MHQAPWCSAMHHGEVPCTMHHGAMRCPMYQASWFNTMHHGAVQCTRHHGAVPCTRHHGAVTCTMHQTPWCGVMHLALDTMHGVVPCTRHTAPWCGAVLGKISGGLAIWPPLRVQGHHPSALRPPSRPCSPHRPPYLRGGALQTGGLLELYLEGKSGAVLSRQRFAFRGPLCRLQE